MTWSSSKRRFRPLSALLVVALLGIAFGGNARVANAATSYTVTFNGNGSTSGSMSPETSSAPTALTVNGYARTGFVFTGWNTAANGSGTAYANEATYAFTANITLYAQWAGVSEAATFPVNVKALGGTTLSINPQKVGDLIVFSSQIWSQTITVTGVSCPETSAWQLAKRYVDTVNGIITEELWWATATATGPTTITATYSASVASLSPELVSDSFTSTSPLVWSFGSGGGAAATNTSTIAFPSLTSGSTQLQLYWSYAESTQTASAGSTSGFTYDPTAAGNLTTFNDALNINTAYAPTATQTAGSNDTAIAGIFSAQLPSQTISYTSTAPASATVGGTYTPTATATSGLGVLFTIDSASAGCSISSGVVTFISPAGICMIDANQPGNASYAPAPQVQQSFSVGQGIPVSLPVMSGTLAFVTAPSGFSVSTATLNGTNQSETATQTLDIGDNTGSGSGWNVTLSNTPFTSGSNQLANSDFTVPTLPTSACDTGISCNLANLGSWSPYTLPGASATKLLSAAANTGMANQTVTINWDAAIPADTYAGSYTSTWTLTLASGP